MDIASLIFSILGTILSGLGLWITIKTLTTVTALKERQRKKRQRNGIITFLEERIMSIPTDKLVKELTPVQKGNCTHALSMLNDLDDKINIEKNLRKVSRYLDNEDKTVAGLLDLFTAIHEELIETEVE